ncbi:hypothetical protein LXL04_035853 [Taraxacum kok-saghyz]
MDTRMKHIHSLRIHTWFFVIIIFVVLSHGGSLHPHHFIYREKMTDGNHQIHWHPKEQKHEESYPTGSSIPDCSHACGPCFPCRRVIIGYKCPMTESCPVIYRCICRGRYYHVPTN